MKPLLLLALALAGIQSRAGGAEAPPAAPDACRAEGDIRFICGLRRPEDLVHVPGTPWVVASALDGGLFLIDVRDRSSRKLYPTATSKVRFDTDTYTGCPGPPNEAEKEFFVTAGLAVRTGSSNSAHTIYAVHFGTALHGLLGVTGSRRYPAVQGNRRQTSVEVFELDTRGTVPQLTWVGCAAAPQDVFLNSVAPLPQGGFVASNPNYPGKDPVAARARMVAGEINSEVWEWRSGDRGWSKVPGSEASGTNGVAASADGAHLYVAGWGSQSFIRLSRTANPPRRDEVPVGFRIDNLHWAPDGTLLGAGQTEASPARVKVVKIEPDTLAVRPLIDEPVTDAFRSGSAAIQVGREIWIGSPRGNRIAIVAAPP